MNAKFLIPVVIIAIVIVVSFAMSIPTEPEIEIKQHDLDFSYSDLELMQTKLAAKDIYMSSLTAVTDRTIDHYCTFFDENDQKQSVSYCATTALLNLSGDTVGNLNMGGTSEYPILALAIVDSKFIDSKQGQVEFIFKTVIDSLVCDCWEEQKPGGFSSVSEWIDLAAKKYDQSGQITLKSTIEGIDNKQVILEITNTGSSYIWTLIVLK